MITSSHSLAYWKVINEILNRNSLRHLSSTISYILATLLIFELHFRILMSSNDLLHEYLHILTLKLFWYTIISCPILCINVPHDVCNNLPQGHIFRINACACCNDSLYTCIGLCNVVRHYIQYVWSNVYKPFFMIDCTG